MDRVKSELDYLRRALDSENRSLVNELAELRLKTNNITNNINTDADDIIVEEEDEEPKTIITTLAKKNSSGATTPTEIILNSIELNIPEPIHDLWSYSRIRQQQQQQQRNNKKKRTVQDLHEVCN